MDRPIGKDDHVEIEVVPPGNAALVHACVSGNVEVPLHDLAPLVEKRGERMMLAVREVLQPAEAGVCEAVRLTLKRDDKWGGHALDAQERDVAAEAQAIDACHLEASIQQT